MKISGYHIDTKSSYYIVSENYHFQNTEEMRACIIPFCAELKGLGFDTAVYGKYNNFKCVNQSKPKADAIIQAYIEG